LVLYVLFAISLILWGPWMWLAFPLCVIAGYAIAGILRGLHDAYIYHTRKES